MEAVKVGIFLSLVGKKYSKHGPDRCRLDWIYVCFFCFFKSSEGWIFLNFCLFTFLHCMEKLRKDHPRREEAAFQRDGEALCFPPQGEPDHEQRFISGGILAEYVKRGEH